MSRYARRKDTSHRSIVDAFEAHGCSVLVIDCSAKDAWDLEVGFLGLDHGVEAKPTLAQANGRVAPTLPRPSQAKFHAAWRGAQPQVVHSPEEVAALVKLWRQESATRLMAAAALARGTRRESKCFVDWEQR